MRPIEPLDGEERVIVPSHLLSGRGGEHYVLLVVGDSMTEEGIHDGDFVIVQRREAAEPGEMVVALIGDEATLKYYYPDGDFVRFESASSGIASLRYPVEDVRIQGVVVGLMRKFARRPAGGGEAEC